MTLPTIAGRVHESHWSTPAINRTNVSCGIQSLDSTTSAVVSASWRVISRIPVMLSHYSETSTTVSTARGRGALPPQSFVKKIGATVLANYGDPSP
jgi:hypothetical protein